MPSTSSSRYTPIRVLATATFGGLKYGSVFVLAQCQQLLTETAEGLEEYRIVQRVEPKKTFLIDNVYRRSNMIIDMILIVNMKLHTYLQCVQYLLIFLSHPCCAVQ
jgi:hypothetical protein